MTAKQTQEPAQKSDIETLLPITGKVTIEGIEAQVKRIRTRELVLLVRVITKGVGPNLSRFDMSSKDQATQSAALLIAALPEAIDEVLLFLREIVVAVNPDEATRLTKAMHNPDLDALFDIVAMVIDQEWDDGKRLLGKARALIAAQQQARFPTGN